IKALTHLKNGELIQELNSAEAARWVRQGTNKEAFLGVLDMPAELKERQYPVVIPFLPISSPIHDTDWLRTLELENNLE
ncbi:hypothetical protein BDN67DRAFT_860256, partial [Paxillus ammoniavirescens]